MMTDNEIFKMLRYSDYLFMLDGKWYLATYNINSKSKCVYRITKKMCEEYGIDYNLLYDNGDNCWNYSESKEYLENLNKFLALEEDREFIMDCWNQVPLYKVFTDETGEYIIKKHTKIPII